MIILIVEERFFPKDTNLNFIDTVCKDTTLISRSICGRDFRIYRDKNGWYTHDDIYLKIYTLSKKDLDSFEEEDFDNLKDEIDCDNDTYINDFKDLEAGEYEIQLKQENNKDYESGVDEFNLIIENIVKLN